jgi:hypothetical protein
MADDVILNKAASIERCVHRIEEEHAGIEQNLVGNQTADGWLPQRGHSRICPPKSGYSSNHHHQTVGRLPHILLDDRKDDRLVRP